MWDLSSYEDVNARIKRFRSEFPTGRLEAYIDEIDIRGGFILVRALAFRTAEDEKPAAIDFAFETRDKSRINAHWWVENAVTSAYGRVIGCLTPSEARPTRQDMEKAQELEKPQSRPYGQPQAFEGYPTVTAWEASQNEARHQREANETPVPTVADAIEAVRDRIGAEEIPAAPVCRHGHMLEKTGINAKTGKEYRGWVCPEKRRESQCEAIWMKQDEIGRWSMGMRAKK